jgi:membrane protein implicated in regulation of membrane protease activity
MDEIRRVLAKIYNALVAWMEFGILWLAMLIVIPYAIAIGVFLIFLPIILLAVGLGSDWFVAIYIFAVMALVGTYCYWKYVNGDTDTPIAGRSILPEERAIRKSRSIMRNSRSRRR